MPATLQAPARAATVLVVDDDPDLRTVLRLLLEDEGYTVQLAGDGYDALARVQAETPDLILLDLNMPLMTGGEVAVALREQRCSAPIVIMTAAGEATRAATRLGAAGSLAKPFDLDTVLEIVERLTPDAR
jgi:CheY-like chemotaxis protein